MNDKTNNGVRWRPALVGMLVMAIAPTAGALDPPTDDHQNPTPSAVQCVQTALGQDNPGGPLSPSQIQAVMGCLPGVPLVTGLKANLTVPAAVAAGSTFKAMATVEIAGPVGIAVVEVVPTDVSNDPCGPGSVETMAGFDVGNDHYLLVKLPAGMDVFTEEFRMHFLPPYVRLSVGYNTLANVNGDCQVLMKVIEPYNPLALPFDLGTPVAIQLPAVPMPMGAITSAGSWDTVDQASVTTPAVPVLPYVVVSPEPTVTLEGIASHSDGRDLGDYGRFWFGGGTAACNGMSIPDDTLGQAFACSTAVPHERGKIVNTTYCFIGYYVDGGVGETWEEPHGETCGVLSAYEPEDPEGGLGPDVCPAFWSADAQAQFLRSPVAYVRPATGPFAGSVMNIGHAQWEATCKDVKPPIALPTGT